MTSMIYLNYVESEERKSEVYLKLFFKEIFCFLFYK